MSTNNLQLIKEIEEYSIRQKESELEALINTFLRTENNNFRAVIEEYFPRAVVNGKYNQNDSDRIKYYLGLILKLFEAYGDLKKRGKPKRHIPNNSR